MSGVYKAEIGTTVRVASIREDGQTFHDKRTPVAELRLVYGAEMDAYTHHRAPQHPRSSWLLRFVVVFIVKRVKILRR